MISIKTRNIESISKSLSRVPFGARGAATESVAKVLVGNQATGLMHYPAKPPKSTYVRTYDLRFGWKVEKWGDGVTIRIINAVPYSIYVQGTNTQAKMHKGRWQTVAETIASNHAAMDRAIQQAVNRYLKDLGLL